MTNADYRRVLCTAKCYNRTVAAREGWAHKIDSMRDEQVYMVYQRFHNSKHIYIEVLQIDGTCIACHDTGRCRASNLCDPNAPSSIKYFDKLADDYVAAHPEHANAIIAFRFEPELKEG